jgi:hypothetical protein
MKGIYAFSSSSPHLSLTYRFAYSSRPARAFLNAYQTGGGIGKFLSSSENNIDCFLISSLDTRYMGRPSAMPLTAADGHCGLSIQHPSFARLRATWPLSRARFNRIERSGSGDFASVVCCCATYTRSEHISALFVGGGSGHPDSDDASAFAKFNSGDQAYQ